MYVNLHEQNDVQNFKYQQYLYNKKITIFVSNEAINDRQKDKMIIE